MLSNLPNDLGHDVVVMHIEDNTSALGLKELVYHRSWYKVDSVDDYIPNSTVLSVRRESPTLQHNDLNELVRSNRTKETRATPHNII